MPASGCAQAATSRKTALSFKGDALDSPHVLGWPSDMASVQSVTRGTIPLCAFATYAGNEKPEAVIALRVIIRFKLSGEITLNPRRAAKVKRERKSDEDGCCTMTASTERLHLPFARVNDLLPDKAKVNDLKCCRQRQNAALSTRP